MMTRAIFSIVGLVAAATLGACGNVAGPAHEMPPDAAPDAPDPCSLLTCDPDATCAIVNGGAACACNAGFTGDGKACQDIDECKTSNGGCPASCQNTPGSFQCYVPATCADLKAHMPAAVDGTFTLYLDGDATRPWSAFCAGMAASPAEYLSVDAPHNSSQYASGGASPGTTVVTTFSRVRFDPVSHEIDISDRTFATSSGTLDHENGGTLVTSMPYAVAMDCHGPASHAGLAEIALTGTAFALDAATLFTTGGTEPGGMASITTDHKHAKLAGGGNCGWTAPSGAPADPFNDHVTDGRLLKLVYAP